MKLGYMMLMVAVGAMLMFAPAAMGAKGDKGGKGHGDPNAIIGAVKSVDGNNIVITTKDKGDKEIVANADTVIGIGPKGEQKGEIKDVAVGAHVAVTLKDDGKTATKIVIMPPREKKK